MYNTIWLVNRSLSFYLISLQHEFSNRKKSGVRKEVSNVNKSLCKNIFLVSSRLCTLTLVYAPPQLTIPPSPTTPSTPRNVSGRKFPTLKICQSPNKFTGKRKTKIIVYLYIYMRSLFWSARLGWCLPPSWTKKTRIPVVQPIRIRSQDSPPRWLCWRQIWQPAPPCTNKNSPSRGGVEANSSYLPSGATRRTTPSAPTSSSHYDKRRGGDVRITVVPLYARLLDALRQSVLCPHASEMILAPSSPSTLADNRIEGSGLLLRRMVHAACADVYAEQGDMLIISFRGRKVLLLVNSVVSGGVKEDEGGVAVDSHVLPEILRDLNYKDSPIILHMIFPSTNIDNLWYLGCII